METGAFERCCNAWLWLWNRRFSQQRCKLRCLKGHIMNKKVFLPILFLFLLISSVYAQGNVTVDFFWNRDCPHCKEEKPFLDELEQKYPIQINSYELHEPGNVELFSKMAEAYGTTAQWVPAAFICDEYIVGFDSVETTGKQIVDKIKTCIKYGCTDLYLNEANQCLEVKKNIVNVPLLGDVELDKVGLPFLTVVLGGLDGFNPCAIWVLSFLLTLLVYSKSRKKMLLIGAIFVAA